MMEILVTAASKHGATAELATWLAEDLRAAGLEATLLPPEAVASIARFDAVVLGSGVYAGHWLDDAKHFARHYSTELQAVPVWIFSSGPIGEPLKPDEVPVDVAEIETLTKPVAHRILPGRIDKARLGFGERAILAALRVPDGDFRRRDELEAWAAEIATALRAETKSVATAR